MRNFLVPKWVRKYREIYKQKGLPEKMQNVKPITYSVVKHGMIGLTKYTSTFWNKKNIRCNAVAFGGVYKNQDKNFIKLKEGLPSIVRNVIGHIEFAKPLDKK